MVERPYDGDLVMTCRAKDSKQFLEIYMAREGLLFKTDPSVWRGSCYRSARTGGENKRERKTREANCGDVQKQKVDKSEFMVFVEGTKPTLGNFPIQ